MAKSLSSILSQIERLQKEAAAIQLEVVARIRKEIAKYGLTAEQLFGAAATTGPSRAKGGSRKTPKAAKAAKAPKYADGTGNTWGGMGKRPDWLREALAAGRALEEFLLEKAGAAVPAASKTSKTSGAKSAPGRKAPAGRRAAAKRVAAKPATPAKTRKPRAKPAPAAETN